MSRPIFHWAAGDISGRSTFTGFHRAVLKIMTIFSCCLSFSAEDRVEQIRPNCMGSTIEDGGRETEIGVKGIVGS